MSLAAGTRLGVFEIVSLIGEGGMGQVYRATDTKLGRAVALKVISGDVATSTDRLERFRREAKALAAIDHPNIVTVFSVEEDAGVDFLTMQLVDGQALDQIIPHGGLPVERIVSIAVGIADALAAAHDKGIVHRDLKPANVMATADGRIKVLDFGLAKVGALDAAGAEATLLQTREGLVMGTVPYMSPEQVAGRAVDHRTDIFSLGVLLYEMASGQRPFAGSNSVELASSILRDTPSPVTDGRSDVPADLARLIRRCLAKDPRERIQTARDVANELQETARSSEPPSAAGRAGSSRGDARATAANAGFWVAVLPFKARGADPSLQTLAEGMADEIIAGLSRFSYLRVIAKSATTKPDDAIDSRATGKRVGARYVIEGSIRQAGTNCRVAVQLIDVVSGANLWAETFDRPFRSDDIFTLQDQLVPRIVSTVADQHGVLVHSMSAIIRNKSDDELTPHEAALCVFGFHERMTPQEHVRVRSILERAVERAPDDSDCWAMLATLYTDEHMFGFNVRPDPLGRAQAAGRRAVELSPSSALASQALAQSLFFRRELEACRPVAERTIALNPMDGAISAFMGLLLALAGEWDRGCAAAEAAMRLNPHYPGWYWLPLIFRAFHTGDYRSAVALTLRINIPGYFWVPATLAASYGQLGELDAAQKAVRELLMIRSDLGDIAHDEFGKWFQPDLVEHYVGGLRKAGLTAKSPTRSSSALSVAAEQPADSGAARTAEGFWVAVLPFRSASANNDVSALADGLLEEIVTGLSRFSHLRVLGRTSTERYSDRAPDLKTVGQEVGARYVIGGSLRQAGTRLRVSVQLSETSTGAQLWADTYERSFSADSLFEVQDDLVRHIVSTCADPYGVLARSIAEAVRGLDADRLSPYEALMRGFGYHQRLTPVEHRDARDFLERAVEKSPRNAGCLAMLALVYAHERAHGFNPLPNSLDRSLALARRAVEAEPANHLAYQSLSTALLLRKEVAACLSAAERAIALNPLDGGCMAAMGANIAFAGDWDRGSALIKRAGELNPHHPSWYDLCLALYEYVKGEYRAALDLIIKTNAPEVFWSNAVLAAASAQLGDAERAHGAWHDLAAQQPAFVANPRQALATWFLERDVEHLMEGFQMMHLDERGNRS